MELKSDERAQQVWVHGNTACLGELHRDAFELVILTEPAPGADEIRHADLAEPWTAIRLVVTTARAAQTENMPAVDDEGISLVGPDFKHGVGA